MERGALSVMTFGPSAMLELPAGQLNVIIYPNPYYAVILMMHII